MTTENTRKRTIIGRDYLDEALADLRTTLMMRLNQKGYGTMSSNHEIYGIIAEEVKELLDTIHSNASPEEVAKELRDIAVGCVFGDACLKAGTLDW